MQIGSSGVYANLLGTKTTTDATANQILAQLNVGGDGVYVINAVVSARRTDATGECRTYLLTCTILTQSGSASFVENVSIIKQSSSGSFSGTIDATLSGTIFQVLVTGDSGKTYAWKLTGASTVD